MLDKRLLKNISSLFSIQVAGYILPLITLPYLVRVLEPEGYGVLGFTLAFIQYFVILINYGFDLSATQKIAQFVDDKKYISTLFWNVLTVRVIASVLCFIILYGLTLLSSQLYELRVIVLTSYIAVIGAALFPQWLFQGKEQLGIISTARILLQLLAVPLIFLFVEDKNDILLAVLFSVLPSFIVSIFSAILIKKRCWITWCKPTVAGMIKELYEGWHLFISSAAITLYTTSIIVVLGFVSGPESVAVYVAANKLLQAAFGVYTPISAAYYPRINSLIKKSKTEALVVIKYLMKIQFILTLVITLGLLFMSPYIIPILFGADYAQSIIIIQILSVLPIVVGLSNIFGVQVLISFGYKKEFSKVLIFAGGMSLICLYPLCYWFSAEGAALSALISETMVTLLMLSLVIKKKIPLFDFIRKV
jgi:O-antigen/teichoic acid export membrane protein